MYDITKKRIWVAGHNGMVGRAVVNTLSSKNCTVLTADRKELDLTRQTNVEAWIKDNKPDVIIVCAAKVGGIYANQIEPVPFIYENLIIQANIINSAFTENVSKLVLLGSSCIYPKFSKQPIKEEELLTSELESTNEFYSVAKIAGIKLCQSYRKQHGCDFISVMPCSLYGPNDNFDLTTSHVIPALIRKSHEAKVYNHEHLEVWGTGNVKREFLHVDDAADGIVYLLENYSGYSHINLGSGDDLTIHDLSHKIKNIVGFQMNITFNSNYPDGTPRKVLDISKIKSLGWKPKISLEKGLKTTYEWYLQNQSF